MRTDKTIGLIGTGIFLCLVLHEIEFLVYKILEEALLFTTLKPIVIYGIAEYVSLIVVLLVFVLIMKKIKQVDFEKAQSVKKLFLASILAYAFTQVLGFAQPFVTSIYESVAYFDLKESYREALIEHYMLKQLAIAVPALVLKYVIIALMIYKEITRFISTPEKI